MSKGVLVLASGRIFTGEGLGVETERVNKVREGSPYIVDVPPVTTMSVVMASMEGITKNQ